MVKVLAATGEHDRAEQIARTITEPDDQAAALTGLAKAVGLPQADRLLAKAFALGSWLTPLPVVAQLYPHKISQIIDAVSAYDASCEFR